jgi:mannose-6-phosphate isomerase-like protein (cupin superfamily)
MTMKFSLSKAKTKNKHGIKLHVYTKKVPQASVCLVEVAGGHYQEFYDDTSTFMYYIMKGKGNFFLNGKKTRVKATDVLVIPPKTKIYYLGKMKMLLVNAPEWRYEHEHHVRYIPRGQK